MIHDYEFNINYNKHNGISFTMLSALPEITAQVNMAMATYNNTKTLKLIFKQ
jgi:hypothetical protein